VREDLKAFTERRHIMKGTRILAGLVAILVLPAALSAAEVRGIIASVDLNKGELVLDKVKPKRADSTYVVNEKTAVLYGKESGRSRMCPSAAMRTLSSRNATAGAS